MRYCDYCGKTIPYNTKYCRHCGKTLRNSTYEDTAPLPVIRGELPLVGNRDATTLPRKLSSWRSHISPQLTALEKKYNIAARLLAFALTCALIYIIVTFKNIKDYQILVSVITLIAVVYLWYRK